MSSKTNAILQALLDNKNEYTEHMKDLLTEPMVDLFERIYKDALSSSDVRTKGILVVFQEQLAQVVNWNASKVLTEFDQVVASTGCNYLPDLFRAVIVAQVKINLLVNQRSAESVKLKMPTPDNFLHRCIMYAARMVWKKPYLLYHKARSLERQQYMNELESLIHKAISTSIRSFVPMIEIAKDDPAVRKEEKPESETESETESEDEEESDAESEEEAESESEDEDESVVASDEEESDEESEEESNANEEVMNAESDEQESDEESEEEESNAGEEVMNAESDEQESDEESEEEESNAGEEVMNAESDEQESDEESEEEESNVVSGQEESNVVSGQEESNVVSSEEESDGESDEEVAEEQQDETIESDHALDMVASASSADSSSSDEDEEIPLIHADVPAPTSNFSSVQVVMQDHETPVKEAANEGVLDVTEQKQIDIMSDASDGSSIDSNDPVTKVDTLTVDAEQPMINIASDSHAHVPFGSMLINRRVLHVPKIKHKHKKTDAFF